MCVSVLMSILDLSFNFLLKPWPHIPWNKRSCFLDICFKFHCIFLFLLQSLPMIAAILFVEILVRLNGIYILRCLRISRNQCQLIKMVEVT